MASESTHDKAAQYAYRILAARPLSEKEFQAKLNKKGFGKDMVGTLTARFKELGYLNDETFAGQWARMLAVNKLWGNRRIEISLREKGISGEMIEDAINSARKELTERKALLELVRKKRKGSITTEERKEKRRLAQSLMGKGFPPGLIFEVLSLSGEEEVHDG